MTHRAFKFALYKVAIQCNLYDDDDIIVGLVQSGLTAAYDCA